MMKCALPVENNLMISSRSEETAAVASRGRPVGAQSVVRRSVGFTLVELMIVVAIVAILSAIAYPTYTNYIVKTHRTAAKACLSEYANYMERYYTTNLRYDTSSATPTIANALPALDCASTAQTGNFYQYDFGTPTVSAYTLTATPQGAQTADTRCGTLTLNQSGARTKSGTDTLAQCW